MKRRQLFQSLFALPVLDVPSDAATVDSEPTDDYVVIERPKVVSLNLRQGQTRTISFDNGTVLTSGVLNLSGDQMFDSGDVVTFERDEQGIRVVEYQRSEETKT